MGQVHDIIEVSGSSNSRLTIGYVQLEPNYAHTVPGKATFSIIMRDTDEQIMKNLLEEITLRLTNISQKYQLDYQIEQKSWLSPVKCDKGVQLIIEEAIYDLEYDEIKVAEKDGEEEENGEEERDEETETETEKKEPKKTDKEKEKNTKNNKKNNHNNKKKGYMFLPSGAGHDTQNMVELAPSGMIFIPSINGISHAPEEYTEWADVEKGANVLLHSIVKLLERD